MLNNTHSSEKKTPKANKMAKDLFISDADSLQ